MGFDEYINREAHIHWPSAIIAGLMSGAVVWLLSHGTPWFTSGLVSPTLMGRDLKPPGEVNATASLMTVLAQALVSICYGLAISPAVCKLRGMFAIMAGGLIGLVLYGLNLLVFHFALGVDWSARVEAPVIVTHVVFSMLVAGLYKGLAARRNGRPTEYRPTA